MFKKIYSQFHRFISKPEERGEYSSGVWQDMVRRQTLKLCQNARGKLIEIGCGESLFLSELALVNRELQIFGIDNSNERIAKANKRLATSNIKNIILSCVDAASLPYNDSDFDVVVCINVIFNLSSFKAVENVLSEMARICKKDGRIIVDFRNSSNPFLYFKYKFAHFYDQTVRNLPLKTYRLEEMQSLLDKIGLKITQQIPIGFSIKKIAPVIVLEAQKK